MGSQAEERYRHYQAFYLRDDKGQADRYRRQVRDYRRKYGDLLAGAARASALDIGCANGMLAAFLKEQGFDQVVGIDCNAELIEQARANVEAEFHAGDALEFLRAGRQFDVIFLLNIVEHIERDRLVEFMTAVRQSLCGGGFAVVRTPNMNHLLAAGHLADDLTHFSGLTEQSLRQLAQAAGFGRTEFLDQFSMQNVKGKVKTILAWPLHKILFWLRGGSRPRLFYRNLYARLTP
ncbi:MAG: class I SAM-dependent methyltransferase [Sedimentisphaerales bacterium]|nr:class I SAM-dependent methyltransferase [Sedimentisphaerales bacterium]